MTPLVERTLGCTVDPSDALTLRDFDDTDVEFRVKDGTSVRSVMVSADELAEALVEASPAFARALGSLVRKAVLHHLGREE